MTHKINNLKINGTNAAQIDHAKIILIVCSSLFLLIAAAVHFDITRKFDIDILLALRNSDNLSVPLFKSWLLPLMQKITMLGNTETVITLTGLMTVYCAIRKEYRLAWIILTAVIGAGLLDFFFKWAFDRSRPEAVPHLVQAFYYSFPSGHAFISSVLYTALAFLITKFISNKLLKLDIILITALVIFLIGFSRVYLGVHYPTDVIAGWLIGISWISLCWILSQIIAMYSVQKGH